MCCICENNYDEYAVKICCCEHVEILPYFPNLKHLIWNWADNIRYIPYLPYLTNLDCSNSYILSEEIPYLPNLEVLLCFNSNIKFIHDLPKLKDLDCYNTSITRLPYCPLLIYLDCEKTNISYVKEKQIGEPKYRDVTISKHVLLSAYTYSYYPINNKKYNTFVLCQKLYKFKLQKHKLIVAYNPLYIIGYLTKCKIRNMFL